MTAYSTISLQSLNIVGRGAVFLAALFFLQGLLLAAPGGIRAGAAVADITPPPGLPLWGYGGRRDLPSQEARDKLEVSVLVLEFNPAGESAGADAAERRLALVGIDMGRAPGRATMKKIRAAVLARAGVGNLFLVASHTHHGPCMELEKRAHRRLHIKAC